MATINRKNYSSPRNINLKDGCLRFGSTNSSTPFDSASYGLYVDSSDRLVFSTLGADTILGAAGAAATTWDTLYAADKTLSIDSTTLLFTGSHATNDVFTIANAGGKSGDCVKINNSGTGKDISGTSDTWSVTKAGVFDGTDATLDSITIGSGAAHGTIDSSGDYNLILQTGNSTTCDITLVDGADGDVDITLNGAGAVNINGTTGGEDSLVIASGDVSIADGAIIMADADDATAVGITADSCAAHPVIDINADGLTSGYGIHIDTNNEASFTTGGYFECFDGTASAFTIKADGATVIAGSATGTDALTLTAGDITVTDGDVTMTVGNLLLSDGNVNITESSTSTAALTVAAGVTSADAVVITADSLTGTESAVSISVDALVDGVGIKVENTGETLTSGELLQILNTESGNLATKTGNVVSITSSLDETAGTVTSNYDMALFSRTDTQTHASQYDAQGSVVKILKTLDKAAGTIVDAVIGLEIESAVANTALPLGATVQITEVGVGATALNIVSASVGVDNVLVTASGALTNGFAGLHVTLTGNVATGGAALLLDQNTGSPNAAARMFEIEADGIDMIAVYIDVDSATEDGFYMQSDGNIAAGKAVMHVDSGGTPAADNCYVGHFAFTGTATAESVVLFADGSGKDVTGILIDCDPAYSAANLSAQLTLFSDAAGDLPILMQFYHDDSGAASGEYCAKINFFGHDDNDAKELYASIEVEQDDASNAAPDGILWIKGDLAGTNTASAGFTGNTVMLGAAAATLTSAGSWDLTLSTALTAANEPKIVLTDGATGNITVTAGGTSGEIDLASPVLMSGTQAITGSGTINATTSITELNSTGGGAYGMDDGVEGQIKLVVFKTDPGTNAVITPTSQGGYTTHTMADAGDSVTFLFTNSAWYVIGQGGLAGGGVTA